MRAAYRPARLLILALLLSVAAAQDGRWTIQTVAFPDYRLAEAEVERLAAMGFDVYTEFTMFEGRQYTRIRIGCFTTRPAAELMAQVLAGRITDEAVVQPFTESSAPSFCLRDDIGFIKPADWSIQTQDSQQIVFRVQFSGHTGFVRMRGAEWRLLTAIEPATSSPAVITLPFEQVTAAGQPVVRTTIAGQPRLICPGRLLWQGGSTAVVERNNTVAGCMVEPVRPGAPL